RKRRNRDRPHRLELAARHHGRRRDPQPDRARRHRADDLLRDPGRGEGLRGRRVHPRRRAGPALTPVAAERLAAPRPPLRRRRRPRARRCRNGIGRARTGRRDRRESLPGRVFTPGASDLVLRRDLLAERLTPGLQPLASVAYNYAWSWDPDGPSVFRDINPHRWELSGESPVRFLNDLWPSTQEAAEQDTELLARIEALAARVDALLDRPALPRPGVDGPVVFMCAEFGFHPSMPIYSGGLGVLAGDILKEASDRSLEMVGIGLLYRRGYFRQRLDLSGRQQEY